MQLNDISDRITAQLDELRDRTADAVGADGGSLFKELHKLGKQLGSTEKRLAGRIDDLADAQAEGFAALLRGSKRTTWPRRFYWLVIGAAAGAIAAYLNDPERGDARRQQLTEQLTSTANQLRDQATQQAEQAVDLAKQQAEQAVTTAKQQVDHGVETVREKAHDLTEQTAQRAGAVVEGTKAQVESQVDRVSQQAKGAATEAIDSAKPDTATDDPGLLRDRIKSTVFGHRDDVQDVILKVDGPGRVSLKGTVASATSERELLAAVAEVDGVVDVRSELTVRAS